jgi:hypothetical protein
MGRVVLITIASFRREPQASAVAYSITGFLKFFQVMNLGVYREVE